MDRRWACGILAMLTTAAAVGRAEQFGDVRITLQPPASSDTRHGYTEYAALVANQSASTPHQVTLTLPKTDYRGGGHRIRAVTRTVDVGPGATVRVSLLVPDQPPLSGTDASVRIDGREQTMALSLNLTRYRSSGSYYGGSPYRKSMVSTTTPFGTVSLSDPLVLFSPGVPRNFLDQLCMTFPFNSISRDRFPFSNVPVELWGTNWLAYSSFDGIVVTSDEMGKAPAGVKSALWQYAECGGALLILGEATVPPSWKRYEMKNEIVRMFYPGFGQCMVAGSNPQQRIDLPIAGQNRQDEFRVRLGQSWGETAAPGNALTPAQANEKFPVVEDIGVPVRGLFGLMALFTLVIGPLNLFVLARTNRRIWLLWTVPAISLVTCAMVFGYMLLAEGWEGHLRTETLTVLDESAHRAATIGWTAFYAPLTPSDGLHFDPSAELWPQLAEENWYRAGGTARTLDWTQDQHLATGWVSARVPAHFMVRKSTDRRERVTIERAAGDSFGLVNGLGTDISEFWYADQEGRVFTAKEVPAGARASLTATGQRLDGKVKPASRREFYTRDWLQGINNLGRNPLALLEPHSYLAVVNGSPFFEDGLAQARHRKYQSLVLGFPRDSEHEN